MISHRVILTLRNVLSEDTKSAGDAPTPAPESDPDVMNKFALLYTAETSEDPSDEAYMQLAVATGQYLTLYMKGYFTSQENVEFLYTSMTSYHKALPFVVDYDATSHFQTNELTVPSSEQLNSLISAAFGSENMGFYINFLADELANELVPNPFSKTTSVAYASHSSALADQSQIPESNQEDVNGDNAKIIAPAVLGASALVLLAAALVIRRHNQKQNKVGQNETQQKSWSQKASSRKSREKNLHPESVDGGTEAETYMDSPSVSHSYVSGVQVEQLDPVREDDEEMLRIEESSCKSPSQVMEKMNLSSALEDVDLSPEDEDEDWSMKRTSV